MRKRIAYLGFTTAILLASSLLISAQSPRKTSTRPEPRKTSPAPEPTPPDTSPQVETLKIDTNLVTIPVIATDEGGLYIPDLRKDEFSVYEDDVKQNIAFFGTVNTPFHVILMLDTSASTEEKLRQIRQAALAFVEQLKSADRVKVISFDDQVRDLNEFTNDREQLKAAILKTRSGEGTKLYDAFGLALDSLRQISGRKAIVLFTDGVDWHSDQATLDGTLHGLDEEGVIVYPIRFDTRVQTERLAREQANDSSVQLPTIGVIRAPSPGTTAPTFPSDEPSSVPAGRRTSPGILGLPAPGDIMRGRRRPDDPNPDDRGGPDRRRPEIRRPPDNRAPTSGPIPGAGEDPNRSTQPTIRPNDSITAMLDQLYRTADSYLKELADKSGGRLLRADTLGSLPDAFAKIAAELRTQYSLGYYPTNTAHDGLYRKVKIVISRKKVVARARPGYRAPRAD